MRMVILWVAVTICEEEGETGEDLKLYESNIAKVQSGEVGIQIGQQASVRYKQSRYWNLAGAAPGGKMRDLYSASCRRE